MLWKVAFPVLAAVLAVGFGALVGGWTDMGTGDPAATTALRFAVNDHNKQSNNMYRTEVLEVLKAQKQVVGGMKYMITVRMGRTSCRKDSTSENCTVHQDPELAQPYNCTFTVWSKPWQNYLKVLSTNCDN